MTGAGSGLLSLQKTSWERISPTEMVLHPGRMLLVDWTGLDHSKRKVSVRTLEFIPGGFKIHMRDYDWFHNNELNIIKIDSVARYEWDLLISAHAALHNVKKVGVNVGDVFPNFNI